MAGMHKGQDLILSKEETGKRRGRERGKEGGRRRGGEKSVEMQRIQRLTVP